MTRKELRNWLEHRKPMAIDNNEKVINWILDALQAIKCTIDVERLEKECRNCNLRSVLHYVAYGTPDIPYSIRNEKIYLFNDDPDEFFSLEDNDWKNYWGKIYSKLHYKDYIVKV